MSLNEKVEGWWTLNDDSYRDKSAYDRHGEPSSGSFPIDDSGPIGKSVDFSGKNSNIDTGWVVDLGTDSYTAEVWFNADESQTSNFPTFLSNYGGKGIICGLKEANGAWRIRHFSEGDEVAPELTSFGEWHHYVAVRSQDTISVYLNGGEVKDSRSITPSDVDNSNTMRIGSRPSEAQAFQGSLSEAKIYRKAMTEDEVNRLYQTRIEKHRYV